METLYQPNQSQQFNSQAETMCSEHNLPLDIVCLQTDCDFKGLICVECINSHMSHQMISYQQYEKELKKCSMNIKQEYDLLYTQKKQLINESNRKIQMLRDSINSIFKQIEIEKTKECDEMQSRIKIKLTPLKRCQNLMMCNNDMTLSQYNDQFIQSLGNLSRNQEDKIKLDDQFYEALQIQSNFNLKLRLNLENHAQNDISWLNEMLQDFMKQVDSKGTDEDQECNLDISQSPQQNEN